MELPGVSRTAVGVAHIRAVESERRTPLFVDPYAAAFVAAAGGYPTSEQPSPQRLGLVFHVIIRTRYFDDYLVAATTAGIRQVVLLAAGLDARAFRLEWPPATRLFELDLPDLLEVKERVLIEAGAVPACDRSATPVDLRDDWLPVLRAAGWSDTEPTAWLAEGLLVYLTEAEAEHVLDRVTAGSSPGSRLALERSGRAAHDVAAEAHADVQPVTSLWQGGLGEGPEHWLGAHGWTAYVDNLADVAASYGRPISRSTDSGFITAHR